MEQHMRAVIFDFGGLLMDTESANAASWEGEWAAWGLVLDRDSFFVPHGGDVTEHRYLLLAAAVGDWFDRALSHARRSARRDELDAALPLAAGIDSWLTHKPSLDVYRLALARLEVEPVEAVAVQDTAHGVVAVQAAGLACIAIPNPFAGAARVSHAELVLRSAEDCPLPEAVRLATGRPAVSSAAGRCGAPE